MSDPSAVPEGIAYHIPHIATPLAFTWFVWLLLGAVTIVAARRARLVPGPTQSAIEAVLQYVIGLADEIVGPKAPRYYPLFVGLFFYLLVGNIIGLIPGFYSPTGNMNTTFGLAGMVFLYYNFEGIRENGWGYFKQFLGPHLPWYLLPVRLLLCVTDVISFFLRPLSLGLRLFCNIFSKEIFLAILAYLIVQFMLGPTFMDKAFMVGSLGLRLVILLLGILIALIQALVFVILSMSYIGGALHAAEQH
jgi:F-type H+-transporting ATPase subunit a